MVSIGKHLEHIEFGIDLRKIGRTIQMQDRTGHSRNLPLECGMSDDTPPGGTFSFALVADRPLTDATP